MRFNPAYPAMLANRLFFDDIEYIGIPTYYTFNGCQVRLMLESLDDGVDLSLIEVVESKNCKTSQGYGSSLLRRITQAADRYGIRLTAFIQPLGTLSTKQLLRWYEGFGFEQLEDDEESDREIVRMPRKVRFNPAYPAMLAHDWNKKGQPDPKGYWASEKYDGLRALWDGENFYSRNGKIFHAPQWFKDTLPNTPLDGELWLERSVAGYQKAVSAVRKKVGGKEWENITYMVFDIPTSTEPFEKVQAKLKRMNLGKYAEVAPQYKVKSKSDMLKHYEAALAEGAEGIMLREPGSRYTATRSASLLKVKPEDTAEAVVTGYQAGTGKHQGRMGALHVYLLGDKSKVFKIGTGFKDYQRESPPPIGSIVEFKFNDKTARGIPRFPAFLRVRTDMMDDRPKRKAAKPKGKRVLFSGSRHWDRVAPVRAVISSIPRGSTAIHGGAKGLDSLAGRLAQEKGLAVEVYEADWSRGRKAGPERNQEMVDAGADIVYAFPVEGSRGTWDLVKRARKAGIPVQVYGEDFGTTKTKAAKPAREKTRAKAAPKRKARKPAAKSSRTAADYFSMSKGQLVASGDAGAKKELKRRGRDARGNKVG